MKNWWTIGGCRPRIVYSWERPWGYTAKVRWTAKPKMVECLMIRQMILSDAILKSWRACLTTNHSNNTRSPFLLSIPFYATPPPSSSSYTSPPPPRLIPFPEWSKLWHCRTVTVRAPHVTSPTLSISPPPPPPSPHYNHHSHTETFGLLAGGSRWGELLGHQLLSPGRFFFICSLLFCIPRVLYSHILQSSCACVGEACPV